MSRITEFEMRNVRCFDEVQSARINRITLLVGENNTGKSTFLGCFHALARLSNLNDIGENNHFDVHPFDMGPFVSIVRDGGSEFSIGAAFRDNSYEKINIVFEADGSLPVDSSVVLKHPDGKGGTTEIKLYRPANRDVLLRVRENRFEFDLFRGEISYRSILTWLSRIIRDGYYPFAGELEVFKRQAAGSEVETRQLGFQRFAEWMRQSKKIFPSPRTFETATVDPILPPRSRIYPSIPDYLKDDPNTGLLDFLDKMGETLGLWNSIQTHLNLDILGYEVLVGTPSGPRNIVDVGFGVHCLLPILSKLHGSSENSICLFQEPEGHVHPCAQALLAQWMAESSRNVIIETHSNHFLNRLRICAKNGILEPDDLSIIYFEPNPERTKTRLHSIAVDKLGNFLGAPRSYGSFFRTEGNRLLGLE